MTHEIARDRAYCRLVYIPLEEVIRFTEFTHINSVNIEFDPPYNVGTHMCYPMRVKKQELVLIRLSFNATIIKTRPKKKKIVTPTGTRKTI